MQISRTMAARPMVDRLSDECDSGFVWLRRVHYPNILQLDARRQHLEQPTAKTEQHRNLVNVPPE
jgi:hypothetical protein